MPRKPKEISPTVQKIILTMIRTGDSDARITRVTGVNGVQYRRLAENNPQFKTLLEKAIENRGGGLGKSLRATMISMIRKGHPWWAKLAIHNYDTGLRDPDVVSGGKLKKMIDGIARKNGADATEADTVDPAMASAEMPPGTIPSVESPGAVQDDPRGSPKRKD